MHRTRFPLWALALLLVSGMAAHPVPVQAIILRDGGTLVIHLQDGDSLRLDRGYGSPTRGQFFYDPKEGQPQPLSREELKRIYPDLTKRQVPGQEYYDAFVQEMARQLKSPAGNRAGSSKARPKPVHPGARRSP